MQRKVDGARLEKFCATALERAGVTPAAAAVAAGIMRLNDELGISTHGSFHLVTYIKKMRNGSIKAGVEPVIRSEGPAWAQVDACDGLGFIASNRAMEIAIEKARKFGLSYVGVYNSSHFGSCAAHTLQAVDSGLAAFVCTNTFQLMAVPGSRGKVIGNSPFGYAFPAGQHQAVFLDVATSTAALSKVFRAAENGEMVPDGWIVDQKGCPTNDPASPGFSLAPFGGHKGYGIAVGIEILSGVLAGGGFLSGVHEWFDDIAQRNNCCHAFVVFDVEAIAGPGRFKARLDRMIDEIHNEPKAEGVERIYLPGEIELDNRARAQREGLELLDPHLKRLTELGRMLDLPVEEIFL